MATTAVNAQTAARFDLLCDITQEVLGGEQPSEPRLRKMRIRVDLGRKVWCADACPNVSDVGEVTNSQIHLLNPMTDGMRINRMNGSLETTPSRRFGLLWTLSGQCSRAPYTPIPQQAF